MTAMDCWTSTLLLLANPPQPAEASKLKDILYRNNGDGTFTDVTEKAGIANSMLGIGSGGRRL